MDNRGSEPCKPDSLLPPSLRHLGHPVDDCSPPAHQPNNNNNKRAINAFFKRLSTSILDAETTSCSSSSSSSSPPSSPLPDDLPAPRDERSAKARANSKASRSAKAIGDSLNANMQLLEARLSSNSNSNNNCQARSSDTSQLDGPRRARKHRVKARRVERLLANSSLDESGAEPEQSQRQVAEPVNKRSRASRTERYLRRICSGAKASREKPPSSHSTARLSRHSRQPAPYEHDITDDNFHARHTQVGVNPLLQQTPAATLGPNCPPTPQSRDHTSRILVNGASLDKYQRMMRRLPGRPRGSDKENDCQPNELASPSAQVGDVNDNNSYLAGSPNPASRHRQLPTASLGLSLNTTACGGNAIRRIRSPAAGQCIKQTAPCFSTIIKSDDLENTSRLPSKLDRSTSRRSSKNLEEALCELEAIYNSLQLGDEELLDRAERRTTEEFLYKGLTASPDARDGVDPTSRRKTWADPNVANSKDQVDRLKDDMAYRRMHPKERPTSVDGQSSLSNISYLMTSPIPCRRDMPFVDSRSKPRGKEPDVTLDDVVFRSMQYANNTLKVVEPQPPFGIPLGPITAAADSDYLHSNPADSDRARSPFIPCKEPDIVTDDLAFRNLRKDALPPSSRQSSPSFLPSTPSPLPHGFAHKRAARSLSANLYGLVNKPNSPTDPDHEQPSSVHTNSTLDDYYHDNCVPRHLAMRPSWHNLRDDGDGDKREERRTNFNVYSDPDLSNRSCDESSDERIRATCPRSTTDSRDHNSARGTRRSLEPFTEHEISVYKQLCQDLEKLVQLTQATDDAPAALDSVQTRSSPGVSATEQSIGSAGKLDERPIKLEPFQGLRQVSNPSASSLGQTTKDTGDEAADGHVRTVDRESRHEEKEEQAKEEAEKDEDKDDKDEDETNEQVGESAAFLRSVQLAKLSGHWKESTPSSAVIDRRTSLVNGDSAHWQGMNKCKHKYNSMPAKTSSLLMFRQYGSKRTSKNRKSMCSIS